VAERDASANQGRNGAARRMLIDARIVDAIGTERRPAIRPRVTKPEILTSIMFVLQGPTRTHVRSMSGSRRVRDDINHKNTSLNHGAG
jgi:hypothetical protein